MKQLKPGHIVKVKSLNDQKMIVVGHSHQSRIKSKSGKWTNRWEDNFRLARIKKDGEPNAQDMKGTSRFTFLRSNLKYAGRTIYRALQE